MQRLPFIRVVFLFNLTLLISLALPAQEYNYKHYDSRNGLPNSSVYQMLQDRDGFIWFATQAGVSRFDGTHFKNFSAADGVPGNAIIRIIEDSHGRIWLMPFRNAIAYYYKGKIHNQQNDSVLAKLQLQDFVRELEENKNKEILLTDTKRLYHLDTLGNVTQIGAELSKKGLATVVSVLESGEFLVRYGDELFSTDTKTFRYLRNVPHYEGLFEHFISREKIECWMEMNTLFVESPYYGKSYKQFMGPVNTMKLLSDTILCLNTDRGTFIYNLLQQKIEHRFLPNGNVNYFLADKEGGFWFATDKEGVYRLGSPVFKSIVRHTAAGQKLGVYALEKFNDEIWAGCDMGRIMKIGKNKTDVMPLTVDGELLGRHLVYTIAPRGNRLLVGCGNYVFERGKNNLFAPKVGAGSIKAIVWKNDRTLLGASSLGFFEAPIDAKNEISFHSPGRATSLVFRNDSAWFGRVDGLSFMSPDGKITSLGTENPLLRVPIIMLREGLDGILWVATSGNGLIGLRNNKVIWHFSQHNGLNSTVVRCIGIDSGFVWVGTDKELNKIPLHPNPVITRYSFSDEINSEIVNTILVDKNIVYAGTPDGITWFDKRQMPNASVCDLKILSVNVNAEEKDLQQNYSLAYRNNSIRFDYVAISMKSNGNIVYRYRVNGLDTTWKSTSQTSLELISLPPGEYKFELFAVNNFNVESATYSVNISVQNPFWKSTWFIVSAIVLASLVTWFIGTGHNRSIIRKEKLRRRAKQQLLELEQKALRAQMNPHFIFNCLHSIQSFILDRDAENANKYLSQFASLIRQTLENSFHYSISLADEIKYLTTYLQLEQMRSDSPFEYRINTDDRVSPAAVMIPVMVLQPFVENAVRHGIQAMNGRTGLIVIAFSASDQELICQIEDNGIGREQAKLHKSSRPAAYRSRGMQLTYERIEVMNTNSDKKITVDIEDKFNDHNMPNGTQVIIRFPIFTATETTLS